MVRNKTLTNSNLEDQGQAQLSLDPDQSSSYLFRLNYSKIFSVLFESTCTDEEGVKFLDSDNQTQSSLLKQIFTQMHDIVVNRHEDVIQTIDTLEYFIKILTEIPNKSMLIYGLKIINEMLKGDLVMPGERPFKSFYCVIFYL